MKTLGYFVIMLFFFVAPVHATQVYSGCATPPSTFKHVWYFDPVHGKTQAAGGNGSQASPWNNLQALVQSQPGYAYPLLTTVPYSQSPGAGLLADAWRHGEAIAADREPSGSAVHTAALRRRGRRCDRCDKPSLWNSGVRRARVHQLRVRRNRPVRRRAALAPLPAPRPPIRRARAKWRRWR